MIDVEPATSEDLASIRALLEANDLPVQDLVESAVTFLVARVDGVLAGVVGLEAFGASALLRSLCVAGERRNRGIARSLCAAIESVARGLGVRDLYLLTTTAGPFFERQGFAVGARDVAPSEIRETAEFRDLCPSTATFMRKSLSPAGARYLPRRLLPLRPDVPGARMWAVGLADVLMTYFEVDAGVRFERHQHEGERDHHRRRGRALLRAHGHGGTRRRRRRDRDSPGCRARRVHARSSGEGVRFLVTALSHQAADTTRSAMRRNRDLTRDHTPGARGRVRRQETARAASPPGQLTAPSLGQIFVPSTLWYTRVRPRLSKVRTGQRETKGSEDYERAREKRRQGSDRSAVVAGAVRRVDRRGLQRHSCGRGDRANRADRSDRADRADRSDSSDRRPDLLDCDNGREHVGPPEVHGGSLRTGRVRDVELDVVVLLHERVAPESTARPPTRARSPSPARRRCCSAASATPGRPSHCRRDRRDRPA